MNFPADLFYSKEHTWLRIDSNIGTIGITEYAQSELVEITNPTEINNLLNAPDYTELTGK